MQTKSTIEPIAPEAIGVPRATHVARNATQTPVASPRRPGKASSLLGRLLSALHGDKYLIDPSGRAWQNAADAPAADFGTAPTAVQADATPARPAAPSTTTRQER